jgi:hypothetical protein
MFNALFVNAQVPRGYRPKPGPMFFVRQENRSTAQFGAAFDITPPDEKSEIQKVENISVTDLNGKSIAPERAAAWRVQTANGKYLIIINRSDGVVRVGDIETNKILYVAK